MTFMDDWQKLFNDFFKVEWEQIWLQEPMIAKHAAVLGFCMLSEWERPINYFSSYHNSSKFGIEGALEKKQK